MHLLLSWAFGSGHAQRYLCSIVCVTCRAHVSLVETQVARAGFPVRMQHSEFIARYSILNKGAVQRAWHDAKRNHTVKADQEKDVCRALILECVHLLSGTGSAKLSASKAAAAANQLKKGVSFRDVCSTCGMQLGLTKIFMRQIAYNRAESARTLRLSNSSTKIQTIYRGSRARRNYLVARAGVIQFQAHVRGGQARRNYRAARILHATLVLQTFVRGTTKRRSFLRNREAAIVMQKWARCSCARNAYLLEKQRALLVQGVSVPEVISSDSCR